MLHIPDPTIVGATDEPSDAEAQVCVLYLAGVANPEVGGRTCTPQAPSSLEAANKRDESCETALRLVDRNQPPIKSRRDRMTLLTPGVGGIGRRGRAEEPTYQLLSVCLLLVMLEDPLSEDNPQVSTFGVLVTLPIDCRLAVGRGNSATARY